MIDGCKVWGSDCTYCGNATPGSQRCSECGSTEHTVPLYLVETHENPEFHPDGTPNTDHLPLRQAVKVEAEWWDSQDAASECNDCRITAEAHKQDSDG